MRMQRLKASIRVPRFGTNPIIKEDVFLTNQFDSQSLEEFCFPVSETNEIGGCGMVRINMLLLLIIGLVSASRIVTLPDTTGIETVTLVSTNGKVSLCNGVSVTTTMTATRTSEMSLYILPSNNNDSSQTNNISSSQSNSISSSQSNNAIPIQTSNTLPNQSPNQTNNTSNMMTCKIQDKQ